jgi:hypothetical protein
METGRVIKILRNVPQAIPVEMPTTITRTTRKNTSIPNGDKSTRRQSGKQDTSTPLRIPEKVPAEV